MNSIVAFAECLSDSTFAVIHGLFENRTILGRNILKVLACASFAFHAAIARTQSHSLHAISIDTQVFGIRLTLVKDSSAGLYCLAPYCRLPSKTASSAAEGFTAVIETALCVAAADYMICQ